MVSRSPNFQLNLPSCQYKLKIALFNQITNQYRINKAMLRREQKTMLSRGGTDPINKDYPKQNHKNTKTK